MTPNRNYAHELVNTSSPLPSTCKHLHVGKVGGVGLVMEIGRDVDQQLRTQLQIDHPPGETRISVWKGRSGRVMIGIRKGSREGQNVYEREDVER